MAIMTEETKTAVRELRDMYKSLAHNNEEDAKGFALRALVLSENDKEANQASAMKSWLKSKIWEEAAAIAHKLL